MKKPLLLLVVLTLFGKIYSQHTHQGIVTDPDGKPLEFVAVLLTNIADSNQFVGTATDASGKFEFNNVKYPSFFVKATVVGYQDASSTVIMSDNKDTIKIIMTQNTSTLNEYTVETKVNKIEFEPGKVIMNVENSTLTAGNNSLDLL